MAYENRNHERVRTLVKVEVMPLPRLESERASLQATSIDISVRGLAFVLDRPFETGSLLSAILELPSGTLSVDATVMRCDPTKRSGWWKTGIKFKNLSDNNLFKLVAFIKAESKRQLI